MPVKRIDDLLVALALTACAALCLGFRYLPMVDLPQHYAMVSILVHHDEPTWGFAQRYTTDFLHRPYATVYWLGEALARIMSLGSAMGVVVAVCTIAPFAGAHALLVATRRPRVWLLPAIPFAFGSLWHWGFLNFLLGTGMFLAGLALVVVAARRRSRATVVALGVLAVVLFLTHFHGLVMLLMFAPLFAWAWKKERGRAPYVRALAPLVPSAMAAAAFVLLTWAQADGKWARMNPGIEERIERFPEFLAAGVTDPWPGVWLGLFATLAAIGLALGGTRPRPRRAFVALLLALTAQVAMYFVLPLNTNTATYVSARHALLVILLAVPLLPALDGWRGWAVRAGAAATAVLGLVVVGRHLACFDREARDFDDVLAAMQPARRVLPLVFARGSSCTHPATFPFLHFAAYYQAAKGGELARSFAVVWNVPIRYRADYARYPLREEVEWAPMLLSPEDARHFDYALMRGGPRQIPPQFGLKEVTRSGAWRLFENPTALPPALPPP
ncbi:MAG TPA: hypothetical protein VIJ22_16590 [Polyangiaceae bacterium]